MSVIGCCVAGAALGDAVSDWIGRQLGPKTMRHAMFRPHRRKIARTRLFTRKYGSASIYIGRFFGPLRAFVPIAAGMLRMPSGRFQLANVLSAAIWVPAMLAPGYFAAKGLAELERLWEADALTLAIAGAGALVAAAAIAWRFMVPRVRRREAVGALMQAVGLRH
jgi:membrane protein DedA with SNARE-associated domain